MTHACQVTEISVQKFPELLQFYHHFPQKYPYLLKTSSHSIATTTADQKSNFDILCIEPEEWLKLDQQLKLSSSNHIEFTDNDTFLEAFDRFFFEQNQLLVEQDDKLIKNLPFQGGWFVFLAYELAQQVEPCLNLPLDMELLPVAFATRVKKALIYDHCRETVYFLTEAGIDHNKAYQSLLNDSLKISQSEIKPLELHKLFSSLQEESEDSFLNSVDTVRNYIKEGDVFQVNLSRLWQSYAHYTDHAQLASALSQSLGATNPAPFSGLASFVSEKGIATVISSSPERLLKVKGKKLESRPIAGTHPRSTSEQEDLQLMNQLHAHPKEQAEHIMLIDLIRNDMGRVCIPGSVTVDELMVNESYAHVHHIVSNVTGHLKPEVTPGEAIKALFPGGTITGCPKVRCMEIIAQLEQHSRGAYTGSMGYINLDGSMDLNILIRTMLLEQNTPEPQKQKLSFRAGAGLVFDSIAEKELHETRAKAKGLINTLSEEQY